MGVFITLVVVMVSHVFTYVETYKIVCFEHMQFILWQSYLHKSVLQNRFLKAIQLIDCSLSPGAKHLSTTLYHKVDTIIPIL